MNAEAKFGFNSILVLQNVVNFRRNSDLDLSTGVGPILEAVLIVYFIVDSSLYVS